jgi:uncharacterized protein YfdQ (DUF2303 family)
MQVEAINRIAELAIQANKANVLAEHTPALVLDNKVVSIENLQKGRSRFRGTMLTSVLSEFVAYVRRHTGGHGFIDPKQVKATTFLNLGTPDDPGHADWKAVLQLDPTAAYAALLSVEGRSLLQRELVEWIEDWSANLSAVKDGESIAITAALTAIREVTIESKKSATNTDRDFGASRSSLEEIEAKAKGGMPSHLLFQAVPYLGLQAREFRLRISVLTGDKPALVLRIVGKEQAQEEIAQEFKAKLLEEIDDAATLTIGSFTP